MEMYSRLSVTHQTRGREGGGGGGGQGGCVSPPLFI